MLAFFFFFFSSRRRHTRFDCDWSSDVCSSDLANELRAQGRSIREAALEAGRERLRPILMTSFAFILGVTPLLTSSGAGAASRHSIGTGVFFGMLVATLVGVFFIPLFFAAIRAL